MKVSLPAVFGVLFLCACGALLMSVESAMGDSSSSTVEQPRLERQLQQLMAERTRMDNRLDKLLDTVGKLQIQLETQARYGDG